jgi:hypothetical protein
MNCAEIFKLVVLGVRANVLYIVVYRNLNAKPATDLVRTPRQVRETRWPSNWWGYPPSQGRLTAEGDHSLECQWVVMTEVPLGFATHCVLYSTSFKRLR